MPYRLIEASGDVAVEARAGTLGAVLVELGRAVADVTTAGSPITTAQTRDFDWSTVAVGLPHAAVGFVNELLFLFDTQGFLVGGGELVLEPSKGRQRVHGRLLGETFDPGRHQWGTQVKAATLHEAQFDVGPRGARGYLLLDL